MNLKAEILFNRGQKTYAAGNWEKAEELLQAAYQANPKHIGVLIHLAYVLINREEREKAKELILKAQDLEPNNPAVYILLGLAEYDLGNLNTARLAWEKALQLEKENPLAQSYLLLLKIKEGKRDFKKADLYPQSDFLARLALILEQADV